MLRGSCHQSCCGENIPERDECRGPEAGAGWSRGARSPARLEPDDREESPEPDPGPSGRERRSDLLLLLAVSRADSSVFLALCLRRCNSCQHPGAPWTFFVFLTAFEETCNIHRRKAVLCGQGSVSHLPIKYARGEVWCQLPTPPGEAHEGNPWRDRSEARKHENSANEINAQ